MKIIPNLAFLGAMMFSALPVSAQASPPVWTAEPPRPAPPPAPTPPPMAYAPPGEVPPPPPPPPLRHGAYARFALGGGTAHLNEALTGSDFSDTATGGGVALDIAVGGALSPVFTIGGNLAFQQLSKPTVKNSSGLEAQAQQDLNVGVVGVMFEGFATATSGFHFGGTLGPAVVTVSTQEGDTIDSSRGVGYVIEVGYDLPVSRTWYIGLGARYIGAHTSGTGFTLDARAFSVMADVLSF